MPSRLPRLLAVAGFLAIFLLAGFLLIPVRVSQLQRRRRQLVMPAWLYLPAGAALWQPGCAGRS